MCPATVYEGCRYRFVGPDDIEYEYEIIQCIANDDDIEEKCNEGSTILPPGHFQSSSEMQILVQQIRQKIVPSDRKQEWKEKVYTKMKKNLAGMSSEIQHVVQLVTDMETSRQVHGCLITGAHGW